MPDGLTLVAGATGALGLQVCEAVRRDGGPLRALVRASADPARVELLEALGAELVVGDLEQPETLAAAVAGARFVVTTASVFPRDPRPDGLERLDRAGSINLVDAAAAAGVRRFVYVSFRAIEPDFPFQQAKRAVEARLAGSGMEFTILRPGSFMDVWCSPMLGFDVGAGAVTVYGDGAARASWICAADVAEFALWALEAEAARDLTLDLGGPDALSYDEVVALYEELTGRPLARSHVALAELEAQYAAAVGPVERSLAAITLSAARGGVTDMREAVALSGIRLTSLRAFASAQLASSPPAAER
jgi:uncharacterized protein YbjT (DUF2867 family)